MSKKKKTICLLLILIVCALAAGILFWKRTSSKSEEGEPSEGAYEQKVETSLRELKNSYAFSDMTEEERINAVQARLENLAGRGWIERDSIYREDGSDTFGFRYADGLAGNVDIVPYTYEEKEDLESLISSSSELNSLSVPYDTGEEIATSSDTTADGQSTVSESAVIEEEQAEEQEKTSEEER